jgi:N-acetylglucosamine kinase-like BadF-type ATPase
MSPRYWIGIDGGSTKTVGVLLDERQQTHAEARGDSTNFNSVGEAQARENLHAIIIGLLGQSGLAASQIAGIGLGISGVSRQQDAQMIANWVAEVLPGTPCLVENDAIIALAAATGGDLFGVVIVSGTGMIVIGVNRAGQRQRSGGWGALLDERGSGFAIGLAALQAVASTEDGLGAPTLLTEAVLSHLKLNAPRELERWTYADTNWARIAALAPLVSACAAHGDAVSRAIVDESARALSRSIEVVARRLSMHDAPFPCVFTGGSLLPGALLTERLTEYIHAEVPCAQIDPQARSPAVGAAQMARLQFQ